MYPDVLFSGSQHPEIHSFPYTTLFRSDRIALLGLQRRDDPAEGGVRPLDLDAHRLQRDHRSEEHTSELQSLRHLVCRRLLEKKKTHLALPKRGRTSYNRSAPEHRRGCT